MFNAHSRPVVPRAAIAEISRVAAGYLPGARMVRPSRRGGQGARMGARRGGKDHRGRGGAPAKRLACARIRPTRVPCVAPRVRHVKQTVSPSPGRRPATRDAAPLPPSRRASRGPLRAKAVRMSPRQDIYFNDYRIFADDASVSHQPWLPGFCELGPIQRRDWLYRQRLSESRAPSRQRTQSAQPQTYTHTRRDPNITMTIVQRMH